VRLYTPKLANIAKLKIALLTTWNDLPPEFIDKAILSFRKDFGRVLLQLADTLNTLNTERAAGIHY